MFFGYCIILFNGFIPMLSSRLCLFLFVFCFLNCLVVDCHRVFWLLLVIITSLKNWSPFLMFVVFNRHTYVEKNITRKIVFVYNSCWLMSQFNICSYINSHKLLSYTLIYEYNYIYSLVSKQRYTYTLSQFLNSNKSKPIKH